MPSKVDVVIVTYNSTATIDRCLASLPAGQAGLTSPLINQKIIIDNTPNNLGFAQAANRGAQKVVAPYILFLNPDAALTTGALEQSIAYLESRPAIGIVGFHLQDTGGHPESSSFGPPVTLLSLFLRHGTKTSLPTTPTPVGWVSAAALLIRRHVFEVLHGFDPAFFMYWEDVDLCQRARTAGYSIVLLPRAIVIHQRGASLSDQAQKTALYDASADKYFRKHYATTIWFLQHWLRRLYRSFSPLAP